MNEKRLYSYDKSNNKVLRNLNDVCDFNVSNVFQLLDEIVELVNEQQLLIGRLQEENLYKNFELKSVDDLKKLKDIFEICMVLIDGAIADEDLELGYESVFQFERRIKKFNGELNE